MKHLKYCDTLSTYGKGKSVLESPWVADVEQEGLVIFESYDGTKTCYNEKGSKINAKELNKATKYLSFTADGEESSISLKNGNSPVLYYSFDLTNWNTWDYSTISLSTD